MKTSVNCASGLACAVGLLPPPFCVFCSGCGYLIFWRRRNLNMFCNCASYFFGVDQELASLVCVFCSVCGSLFFGVLVTRTNICSVIAPWLETAHVFCDGGRLFVYSFLQLS